MRINFECRILILFRPSYNRSHLGLIEKYRPRPFVLENRRDFDFRESIQRFHNLYSLLKVCQSLISGLLFNREAVLQTLKPFNMALLNITMMKQRTIGENYSCFLNEYGEQWISFQMEIFINRSKGNILKTKLDNRQHGIGNK